MKTLKSERLILRKPMKKDCDDLFELLSDEQSCLDDGGYHAVASKEDEDFQKSCEFILNANEHFLITLKDTGKGIGLIHIMDTNRSKDIKEIGFMINPLYRCKGYGKEAVRTVIDYGFQELGVREFIGECYAYNAASRRVLEATGFSLREVVSGIDHPQKGRIKGYKFVREKEPQSDRSCIFDEQENIK